MAINLLQCTISQEGLEDGTSLLLQLSRVSARLRDLTLQLMLAGLQTVARDLQEQVGNSEFADCVCAI